MTPPLADPAVTLELLPERVDLVGFVLMASGLGALLGSAVGLVTGASRTKRAIQPLAALVALLDWDDRALYGVVVITGTIAAVYTERYQRRRGIDPLR